jgi:prephenate dehydrogenase
VKSPAVPAALEQVAKADAVFIAVPFSSLWGVYNLIGAYVRPESAVIDCTSVQVRAREMAEKVFREKGCHFLQCHCLFGPQSLASGAKPLIAIGSGFGPRIWDVGESFIGWMQSRGVQFIVRGRNEHDNEMANSQVVLHSLVRALSEILPPFIGQVREDMRTPSFRTLVGLVEGLRSDGVEPFATITDGNPKSVEVLTHLITALTSVRDSVKNG